MTRGSDFNRWIRSDGGDLDDVGRRVPLATWPLFVYFGVQIFLGFRDIK